MTAALHFRQAGEVLDKARRERRRYAEALDRDDRIAAADHLFNLAVTVLAVRDWAKKTAPEHGAAAAALVDGADAMGRLFDAANISKHGGMLDPHRKHYSPVEIVGQSFTDIPEAIVAADVLDQFYGEPREDARNAVIVDGPGATAVRTKSKATLADDTRHFHLDDADAAIAAWDKFLTDRGL